MEEKSNNSLTKSFFDSIKPAQEASVDVIEALLDSKMSDEIFKDIPIISTSVKLYHFTTGMHEHFEKAKLYAFIKSAAAGMGSDEERQKLLEKTQKNQKENEKAIARIIFILDNYSEIEKASILGKFYVAFLKERIKFEDLQMFAEIINQLLPNELKYFEIELFTNRYRAHIRNAYKAAPVRRLVALGLCYEELKTESSPLMAHGVSVSITRELRLTPFGDTFFRIALDR